MSDQPPLVPPPIPSGRHRSVFSVIAKSLSRLRNFARRIQAGASQTMFRRGLLSLGVFNPVVLSIAIVLTLCCYLVLNLWLGHRIDHTYDTYRIPEFEEAATPEDAVRVCVEDLEWISNEDAGAWLRKHLELHLKEPTHQQILAVMRSISSSSHDKERPELLRAQVTGWRNWSWLMMVDAKSTTGDDVFALQSRLHGGILANALKSDPACRAKRDFLVRLNTCLVDTVHQRIRDLRRINGPIQWIIVFFSFLTAMVLVRRTVLLRELYGHWRGDSFDRQIDYPENRLSEVANRVRDRAERDLPQPQQVRRLEEEIRGLREATVDNVYGNLTYMVGLLPSLGFIGTVWGMGAALVQADQLMIASDQQQAIKAMTQELGFAFDTTLVGLVTAVVLGGCIALLKAREWSFYEACSRVLKSQHIEGTSPESAESELPA